MRLKDFLENYKNNHILKIATPVNVAICAYILSVLVLNPWYDFPVGDDFFYLNQIKGFSLGDFTKSALIGPTVILQIFIGLIWSKFFGLSYLSLRVLSIIASILCIIGIDKVLNVLDIKPRYKMLSLALIIFNPFFYSFSLNFMTENYFLALVILSLHQFLTYIKNNDAKSLLRAAIIGGLSILIRQYGAVLLISYVVIYLIGKKGKAKTSDIFKIIVPFILSLSIAMLWPKYQSLADIKSINVLYFFTNYQSVISKLSSLKIAVYVGYLILPVSASIFFKLSNKLKLLILVISLPIAYYIYKINVFSIGNLFYLEGYQARLRVNIRENLFNNVLFKLFISLIVSVSLCTIYAYILSRLSKVLKNGVKKVRSDFDVQLSLLLLTALGFYLIAVITRATFDRYFYNFFILVIIIGAYELSKNNLKLNVISYFACILLCFITYLLIFDYYRENTKKWILASRINENYNVGKYSIFVDSLYAKTIQMEETNNYRGLNATIPINYKPVCFVQEYVKEQDNILNKLIDYINQRTFTKKYLENPKISDAGLLREKTNHYDSTDILLYEEEYSSPIFNIIGKKMFIRAFCVNNYQNL